MIARIETSPIPSILEPTVIRSMLMRTPRCAEYQARGPPTASCEKYGLSMRLPKADVLSFS